MIVEAQGVGMKITIRSRWSTNYVIAIFVLDFPIWNRLRQTF